MRLLPKKACFLDIRQVDKCKQTCFYICASVGSVLLGHWWYFNVGVHAIPAWPPMRCSPRLEATGHRPWSSFSTISFGQELAAPIAPPSCTRTPWISHPCLRDFTYHINPARRRRDTSATPRQHRRLQLYGVMPQSTRITALISLTAPPPPSPRRDRFLLFGGSSQSEPLLAHAECCRSAFLGGRLGVF